MARPSPTCLAACVGDSPASTGCRRDPLRVERLTARLLALGPGGDDTVLGALGDEPALEVRDRAEDVEADIAQITSISGFLTVLLEGSLVNQKPAGVRSWTARAIRARSASLLGGFELGSDAKIVRWPDRYTDKRGEVMWDTVTRLLDSGTDYASGSQAA